MIEVLKNKNVTTKFQTLVEIAHSGPNIQQRDIAHKLGVTPQAISEYIAQLIKEKMLVAEGRSRYRISFEGVNWIIKQLRELNDYMDYVRQAINDITVCTAIAGSDLVADQKVGLVMQDGILVATPDASHPATGVTIAGARAGEDVGITNIMGIVPLQIGRVTVLRIPGIRQGGTGKTSLARLEGYIKESPFIVSLGLEAYAALRKTGAGFCHYGAAAAAIESAKSGLDPLCVCSEDNIAGLLVRLEEENINYDIIDLAKAA